MKSSVKEATRDHVRGLDELQSPIGWEEIVTRSTAVPSAGVRFGRRHGLWVPAAVALITLLLIGLIPLFLDSTTGPADTGTPPQPVTPTTAAESSPATVTPPPDTVPPRPTPTTPEEVAEEFALRVYQDGNIDGALALMASEATITLESRAFTFFTGGIEGIDPPIPSEYLVEAQPRMPQVEGIEAARSILTFGHIYEMTIEEIQCAESDPPDPEILRCFIVGTASLYEHKEVAIHHSVPLAFEIDRSSLEIRNLSVLSTGGATYDVASALWAGYREGFIEACNLSSVADHPRFQPTTDWDAVEFANQCGSFIHRHYDDIKDTLEFFGPPRETQAYSGSALVEALTENRQLWVNQDIDSYQISFWFMIEAEDPGPVTIFDRPNHTIVVPWEFQDCRDSLWSISVTNKTPDPQQQVCERQVGDPELEFVPITVEEAFDMIEANAPSGIWATFHPDRGYPVRFGVPEDRSTGLDHFDYALESLTPAG